MERAYRRDCFRGRGTVARWLDRCFFSLLGGVCLYIPYRNLALSCLLILALLAVSLLWERRRWASFRRDLWQRTVKKLRQEAWLKKEAARIREEGGVILFPVPDADTVIGLCLRHGEGTSFHCFGEPKEDLIAETKVMRCTVTFHPWGEGEEPSREQVMERIRRNAPRREGKPWRMLLHLPGSRYLLTGCALLALSLFLRRALYWRFLGSLCLMIGALCRGLHIHRA